MLNRATTSTNQSVFDANNHDCLYCPLSKEGLLHPIRVIAGARTSYFELEVLVQYIERNGFVCPLTRNKIDSLEYDSNAKRELDLLASRDKLEDRYEGYQDDSKEALLQKLLTKLNAEQNKYKTSLLKSGSLGVLMSTLFTIALLPGDTGLSSLSPTNTIIGGTLLGLLFAAADYNERRNNHHRFGFFGAIREQIRDQNVEANLQLGPPM